MTSVERRSAAAELRVISKGGQAHLRGHAAVFDSLSEDLGSFREVIDRRAFDDTLDADVRALVNHDPSLLLGRTKSGTLKLSIDERGLVYDVLLPKTQYAADLIESISRKDLSGSSFSFRATKDKWEKRDGENIRTVLTAELIDVSPVTYPAYSATDTTVAQRALKLWRGRGAFGSVNEYYKAKQASVEALLIEGN
jgi:HK97 family phage prohead protease